MNFLSFNMRGLGGRVKKKKVRDLVRTKKVDFMALQNTKDIGMEFNICRGLWGSEDFGYVT